MDSSLDVEILNVLNRNKARNSRRRKQSLMKDQELLGFSNGVMVFKNNEFDRTKIREINTVNKSAELNIVTAAVGKESHQNEIKESRGNEIMRYLNGELADGSQKVLSPVKEHNDKKFIYLKGQKLQVIKHAPNVKNIIDGKLEKLPKTDPNFLVTLNRISDVGSIQSSLKQSVYPSVKRFQPILPKIVGKLIPVDSNDVFKKLSIMKEVGGSEKLVIVNSSTETPGIPLQTSKVPTSIQIPSVSDRGSDTMKPCQCSCKNKSVTASTNTEQVVTVHKGVQTEEQNNLNNKESETRNLISDLNKSDVIIGADVNMGHGPPSLYTLNERNVKLKFFEDLHRCLKWESGNLPIHRGVIQHNLTEVRSQCVVLKVRNVGVNLANINNYTPLQLAVINDVKIDIIRVLLDYKADLSVLDSEGNSVLHLAVEHNRTDLVKVFLEKMDGVQVDINHFNYDGLTPLMMCAFHPDRIDMAELLLKNKAELNLKDLKSGRTAIFHAAESHNAPMVALLLDYGADTKIRNFFGTSVHDAMFELDDIPREIKYPILGRDLKVHEKRKLHQQISKKEQTFKRKRLEIVSTIQKLESKSTFVLSSANAKQ